MEVEAGPAVVRDVAALVALQDRLELLGAHVYTEGERYRQGFGSGSAGSACFCPARIRIRINLRIRIRAKR